MSEKMKHRVFGLYWNRRGELYDVTPLELPGDGPEMCRIRNLGSGTESVQTCTDALDSHLEVGWFRKALSTDLDAGFERSHERGAWDN